MNPVSPGAFPVSIAGRRQLHSAICLFRSKWWTIGYAAAFVAWLLHVGAMALAPLSIVQASLAGGFAFLAVLAERFFGFELGRREWAGVLLASAGLAFLAVTAGQVKGKQNDYELAPMLAFEIGLVALGAALIAGQKGRLGEGSRQGVLRDRYTDPGEDSAEPSRRTAPTGAQPAAT